jgi:hypothetical protein
VLTIATAGSSSIKLIVLVAIPVVGLGLRFALGRPPWWLHRARGTAVGQRAPRSDGRGRLGRQRQRVLALRMLLCAVGPLVVYTVLRSYVKSDAVALAIGGAIPAVWVLVLAVWRRRLDWIALVAVVLFALAIVLSLLSGGSSLPLKIRGAVVTGAFGLACVVSVVAGKPLPLLVVQRRARRDPEAGRLAQRALADPVRRHAITVLTALIGITLLAAAAMRVILAATLSTSTFLSVSSIAQWAVIAIGGIPTLWYVHQQRRRLHSRTSDPIRDDETPAPLAPRVYHDQS